MTAAPLKSGPGPWWIAAFLAGLCAASPFLTDQAMGTREAYNYSLAVADAVTQFRAGEMPLLAGQSEFAFNGRVHPLRTAPALFYAACALDAVTLHQLEFWILQNLVLGFALIFGAVGCYAALRLATPAPPPLAAYLAALYSLSPPVLAAAYGMDLYMSVLAQVLVPPVLAANVLSLQGARRRALVSLAAALAACWLAHPPVALWLTLLSVTLQAAALILHPPRARDLTTYLVAAAVFAVLGGYVFASALTVSSTGKVTGVQGLTAMSEVLQASFIASLLPVSRSADQLGDFQLGYALWIATGFALVGAIRHRNRVALVLLAALVAVLAYTIPIPGISAWLWHHSPAFLVNINGPWPMQRVYLLAAGLAVFAAALMPLPARRRRLFYGICAVALAWTMLQAAHFVRRGFETRQVPEDTARSHASSNIDLTLIAYAFASLPGDFIHGVRDPAQSFRLLAPYDLRELAHNWATPLTATADIQSGSFVATPDGDGRRFVIPTLTVQPGRRYRLDFRPLVPPFAGRLVIQGPRLYRTYALPSAGEARGFGFAPGNTSQLTVWTDLDEPEIISIAIETEHLVTAAPGSGPIAEFTLSALDEEALPIRLLDLVPLRARVHSPEPAYLETPRLFVPGYVATVDGAAVPCQRSPEGLVLLPVPAGPSLVEVRYVGPPVLRIGFWVTSLGWLGFGAGFLLQCFLRRNRHLRAAPAAIPPARSFPLRWRVALVALTVTLAGLAYGIVRWHEYRTAIGPVEIRFRLPRGETSRQQPLLVAGRPQAGMFVYVVYHDNEHVRIGVDVWGTFGFLSDPIRTDYYAVHEIMVEAGALYPAEHIELRSVPPELLARLRQRLHVAFNGRTILAQDLATHPARPAEVTFGRNDIGGSSCEPAFAGEILSVTRRPVPDR